MKTVIFLFTFLALKALSVVAQIDSLVVLPETGDGTSQSEIINESDKNEETYADSNQDTKNGDSINIQLNNKNIAIDDDRVSYSDKKRDKYYSYQKRKKRASRNFRGHLSSFNIGMPNFLDADFEMTRKAENSFMDLNSTKSSNVSIYPVQECFGIIGNVIGITTGIGLDMTSYHFENQNNIYKNEITGIIEPIDFRDSLQLKKSKLSTGFLAVPILLEIHPFPYNQKLFIAGGVVGELKLYSQTKVVYNDNGEKRKEKDNGDFNINPLRYGYIVKMGYDDFGIYGIYYPVRFFEKDKGPELYPFSIGVSFYFD